MTDRTYLAIDLKSFYASAECVARGLDPLDTNLVVADASRTSKTICLAVSPSLKAVGIGGRPRLFEVEQRVAQVNEERRLHAPGHRFSGSSVCAAELAASPGLALAYVTAKPRMAYYLDVSARIYGIYLRFAAQEDVHVHSIDEVFIDATRYLRFAGGSAHELARRIVAGIYAETGITATAGIGTNLYLAKVAMDIVAKHTAAGADGARIAQLDEAAYRRLLWAHRPLTDFWRVGPGTARQLERHGLLTMGDVARCSVGGADSYYNEDLLYRLFGVNAELLIDHAWGWEPCTIADVKQYRPEHSSMGSGQVLHEPYNWEHARIVACEMADQLALDMVKRGVVASQVTLSVGYDVTSLDQPCAAGYTGPVSRDRYGRRRPKSAHGSLNLGRRTAASSALREAIGSLYDRIVDRSLLVRRLNVEASQVHAVHDPGDVSGVSAAETEQPDLFSFLAQDEGGRSDESRTRNEEREMKVQETLLHVKERFGGNAVIKGLNLEEGATGVERNRQIGGHAA
ncbi:DNA methylase [Bifidobacterium pseudolongum subsp. globosum]|nr:type VI secretion protein ImpB [Bifidobacterium pseudolongum]RYQ28082.1 DNA methylase [Bifidobacterium pseudolongum subsp. globosum]